MSSMRQTRTFYLQRLTNCKRKINLISTKICAIFLNFLTISKMAEIETVRMNGNAISKELRAELKTDIETILNAHEGHPRPCLGFIIAGDRTDSQTYVRLKKKACDDIGINYIERAFPEEVTQEEIEATIREFNENPEVNGILVQLPLPGHIQELDVLDVIDPAKDVDGLLPPNVALLHMRGKDPRFIPCTPMGCMTMLNYHGIDPDGKIAVVIGRSNIVGLPMVDLLQTANATVTCCHSRTPDIPAFTRNADIVVAAIGKANFVKGDWLKPGAVVLDVGINSVPDETKKAGYALVGDVDFDSCQGIASLITPVPGGVGPMTITGLMQNTVSSWKTKLPSTN